MDPKVNDDFNKLLEKTYGSDNIGHVEASRGKVHEYLAMPLDYTEEIKFRIDMRKYLYAIIDKFPHKLLDKVKCPWTEKMFKVSKKKINWEMKRGKYFICL